MGRCGSGVSIRRIVYGRPQQRCCFSADIRKVQEPFGRHLPTTQTMISGGLEQRMPVMRSYLGASTRQTAC
jgi:hypothetical protein